MLHEESITVLLSIQPKSCEHFLLWWDVKFWTTQNLLPYTLGIHTKPVCRNLSRVTFRPELFEPPEWKIVWMIKGGNNGCCSAHIVFKSWHFCFHKSGLPNFEGNPTVLKIKKSSAFEFRKCSGCTRSNTASRWQTWYYYYVGIVSFELC